MLKNRTLLYMASGGYRDDYEKLTYEKVILVDKSSKNRNVDLPNNSKVTFLNMEATSAIDYLKSKKIKVDCFVLINEGLYQGGGIYPFFSDFFIGLIHPILSDEFLLVTDINHYQTANFKTRIGKMNWAVEKINTIKPNVSDLLKPSVFSYSQHAKNKANDPDFGNIFHLKLVPDTSVIRSFGNISIELKHGSVWNDMDQLDFVGCKFEDPNSNYMKFNNLSNKTDRKIQLVDISSLSTVQILSLCREKNINHIGLIPWLNGNYSDFYDVISKNKFEKPLKITFYHLHKEDYKSLYVCFGMYFLKNYGYLFNRMFEDSTQWIVFESTLNYKTGYYSDMMCQQIDAYHNKYTSAKILPFTQIKLKFGKIKSYMSMNKDKYIDALINLTSSIINDNTVKK